MEDNKVEFRARREMVGMSQQMLADKLGVALRSVKRWENPTYPWQPPEDACDVIDEACEKQAQVVDAAVSKALDSGADEISLTYWRDAAHYAQGHGGDGSGWQMANANSRMIAAVLEWQGIDVSFGFQGLAAMGADFQPGD
uniref:HTH cro/C1-type domain-containing protein n=1 Tax=uncultured bacterium Contig1770 TaxID=1393510 RepID=W0FMR2_9BACT|nr:hypothetical protein [uncultured bacterium Contig1770]